MGSLLAASLLATLIAVPASARTAVVRMPTTPEITTNAIQRYWLPEESFVAGLVNCNRTGGWVLSDGTCRGYGTGRYSPYVAPLKRSYVMADLVARPYAKLLALRNACSHFLDGDPGYRLRRGGYYGYAWAENVGCRNGYTYARTAVLASHLNMQSEKSTNGGHWRNMKNPKFKWMGVGVWKYGTTVRLVVDFTS